MSSVSTVTITLAPLSTGGGGGGRCSRRLTRPWSLQSSLSSSLQSLSSHSSSSFLFRPVRSSSPLFSSSSSASSSVSSSSSSSFSSSPPLSVSILASSKSSSSWMQSTHVRCGVLMMHRSSSSSSSSSSSPLFFPSSSSSSPPKPPFSSSFWLSPPPPPLSRNKPHVNLTALRNRMSSYARPSSFVTSWLWPWQKRYDVSGSLTAESQKEKRMTSSLYEVYNARRSNGFGAGSNVFEWVDERVSPQMMLYFLLGLNLMVFFMWNTMGSEPAGARYMYNNFTISWRNLSEGRLWTVITSCFSQKDTMHLLMNGVSLWFLAPAVLTLLGPARVLLLYLGGGVGSSLLHVWHQNVYLRRGARQQPAGPWGIRRVQSEVPALGASGSVLCISVLYACLFPRSTIYLYGLLPVPAAVLVAGLVGHDLYLTLQSQTNDRTSHAGHVGGALVGALYYAVMRLRLR